MDLEAAPDPRVDHTPRATNLSAVVAVTAHMHDCGNRDEILTLLVEALPELGPFTVESESVLTDESDDIWRHRVLLDDLWSRPVSLTLRADYPPTPLQATLLELLIQHTGSALRAASLRSRAATHERQLREATDEITALGARALRLGGASEDPRHVRAPRSDRRRRDRHRRDTPPDDRTRRRSRGRLRQSPRLGRPGQGTAVPQDRRREPSRRPAPCRDGRAPAARTTTGSCR